MRQIFIGGTGRSGTTILGKVLGKHRDIYTYPFETRFIIDPDGIIDLVRCLTDDWSPYRGDIAVKRFSKLMEELYRPKSIHLIKMGIYATLPKFGISPIRYTTRRYFGDVIPRDKYFEILEDFLKKIIDIEYRGFWAGTPSLTPGPTIISTKKFQRDILMKICRNFVEELLGYPAKHSKKNVWVDHTPYNVLHASFITELLPNAKIIHIYRDPRDVISSYKTKNWGGNTAREVIFVIKQAFAVWEEEKRKIEPDRYFEIKFEEFLNNTESILNKLMDFLDLPFDKKMLTVDLSRGHVGRWKNDLSPEEIDLVERHLSDIMDKYGYSE